jgi:type IV pilus assembly protein PilN
MKDFNFFSPYLEKKKAHTSKILYGIIIVSLFVALLSGFYYWVHNKTSRLKEEIANIENYLASKETINKIREIKDLETKVQIMTQYAEAIERINEEINIIDVISNDLLENISYCLPKDVYFDALSIDTTFLQIQGTAANRTSIAEFEHNLKELNIFSSVHVLNISSGAEEDNYVFTLKCSMKEVKPSEAD